MTAALRSLQYTDVSSCVVALPHTVMPSTPPKFWLATSEFLTPTRTLKS